MGARIFASIRGMPHLIMHAEGVKTSLLLKCCLPVALAVFVFSTPEAAEIPDLTSPKTIVPDHIAGVKTLAAEGVVNLATNTPDLVIIDARIRGDRKHGYLEDSVSLPDIETNCTTLKNIIPSMNSPTLFYCNEIKCGRSVVAIKIAKSCGYTNTYWFKGGFEEWKSRGFQYTRDR